MTFSYSGPSTSAAFVTGVFNDAWGLATDRAMEAKDWANDAISRASSPAAIGATPQVIAPAMPTAPLMDTPIRISEAQSLFDTNVQGVRDKLVRDFSDFLAEYFGSLPEFDAAQSWLQRALTSGGTGIAPAIEQQLFERERSRLLNEASRSEEEILTTWSARRFPLPPGAATAQLTRLRKETDDKIASAAREVAVQAATLEIENVRFAVGQAVTLKMSAINAAGEYIRTLATAPQVGVQLTTGLVDAQARIASTLTSFYQAQIAAAEVPLRAQTTNAELLQRTAEANQRSAVEAMGQRVQATLSAAQSLGTQAAAALNSLHAQAGIGANESL